VAWKLWGVVHLAGSGWSLLLHRQPVVGGCVAHSPPADSCLAVLEQLRVTLSTPCNCGPCRKLALTFDQEGSEGTG